MQNDDAQNIIFTGFMGTGKTTVGKMLAEKLGREFIDTDDLIEERQGLSIPEIFDQLGEAAFRKMEAEIAKELGQSKGLVISTGGRLMLDDRDRIFTNLYGFDDWGLEGARRRGDWDQTAWFIKQGRSWICDRHS